MAMPIRILAFLPFVLSLYAASIAPAFAASDSCSWKSGGEPSCKPWDGDFFPEIPHPIVYEGPSSRNPLAYRFYNASEVIRGKTMADWLRFSVAFWHSFRGDGSDPFGSPTRIWPWDADGCTDEMELARRRMRANFEFLRKLGVKFWCFHDRDIAPEGKTLAETNKNLDEIADLAARLQSESDGIVPLWGTAQLFKHPRYRHGAATSPEVKVFAYAAAQVKKAMAVTARLGGKNFVFWGGREGYTTLLNTDMGRELDHLAAFLRMAANWRETLGFEGQLFLEPKPHEPSKHQYDWDAATSIGFLLRHNLTRRAGEDSGEGSRLTPFSVNIECNHATLSRHSCEHELEVARLAGALGSIDANTGDEQVRTYVNVKGIACLGFDGEMSWELLVANMAVSQPMMSFCGNDRVHVSPADHWDTDRILTVDGA